MDNFYAMAPIIYTPTVGWACSHFSHLYRRPRGMYFCKYDMGEMASMIYNWESDQVKMIFGCESSPISRNVRSLVSLSVRQMQSKAQ